jgi:hypothetical protein
MTPTTGSKSKHSEDARPLDFGRWLSGQGMNPNRPRPPGRRAALLMDYRAYLEREVGKENAGRWFEKYAPKKEEAEAAKSS